MFKVGDCQHSEGDRRCCECWAGYPKLCECRGLIHAQFIKENWDGISLVYSCDNCGDKFKQFIKPFKQGRNRRKPKWKRPR
jgi:hypothetical protein